MSRSTQMNYASTPRSEDKPKPPSIAGFKFVTVPELTSPDGLPTKIYGKTLVAAYMNARKAIHRDAKSSADRSMSDSRKIANRQARTMKPDPRLAVGTEYGEWVIYAEPIMITNGSGTRVKAVPVRCGCGTLDTRPPASLFRDVSKGCVSCSALKNKLARQSAAKTRSSEAA